MIDFVAYSTARQRTADEARAALPNAPVRSDRGGTPLRRRASVALRRLADRLEPAPDGSVPAAADCR
jgi:hypothetical protein